MYVDDIIRLQHLLDAATKINEMISIHFRSEIGADWKLT